jgi:hypothetical protein
MPAQLREMFQKVTKGALSGNAGQAAREEFKVNGEYVDTPQQGVVGIPFSGCLCRACSIGLS